MRWRDSLRWHELRTKGGNSCNSANTAFTKQNLNSLLRKIIQNRCFLVLIWIFKSTTKKTRTKFIHSLKVLWTIQVLSHLTSTDSRHVGTLMTLGYKVTRLGGLQRHAVYTEHNSIGVHYTDISNWIKMSESQQMITAHIKTAHFLLAWSEILVFNSRK